MGAEVAYLRSKVVGEGKDLTDMSGKDKTLQLDEMQRFA